MISLGQTQPGKLLKQDRRSLSQPSGIKKASKWYLIVYFLIHFFIYLFWLLLFYSKAYLSNHSLIPSLSWIVHGKFLANTHRQTDRHTSRLFNIEGEIHSSVCSTKTFLCDIREPRCKQNNMVYQISRIWNNEQSNNILKSDTTAIYR